MNNEVLNSNVEGPSGIQNKSRKSRSRRKRSRSSSSDSSSSSTSSSTTSSSSSGSVPSSKKNKKKTHRKKQRKSVARKRDTHLLEKLSKDINDLRRNFAQAENFRENNSTPNNNNCDVLSDVSRDLYDCCASQGSASPPRTAMPATDMNFSFDIQTKIKEPTVPRTPDAYINIFNEVQRFDSDTWAEIRYADTQKLYNHAPGFSELETNEEVKAYDTLRHLAYSDKSYAALTFCVLKQKELFCDSIRNLITWSRTADASLSDLDGKINEFFLKGDFHKVSSDLLQMTCGHRAEVIEMRRDMILKNVRDPLIKATLNKVPPSNTHIFNSEKFTAALEKAGGIRKTFWPANKSSSASRAKSANAPRLPSQGTAAHYVPSRGTFLSNQ